MWTKQPTTCVLRQCGFCTWLNICTFYEHSTNFKLQYFLLHTERKAQKRCRKPLKDNRHDNILQRQLKYLTTNRHIYFLQNKQPAKNKRATLQNVFINEFKNKSGIIVFDVSGWGNATGHFTLWDGSHLIYPGDPSHDDPGSQYYYFHMNYVQNSKTIKTTRIRLWQLR